MKYDVVLKYEYSQKFPFSAILDYVDYTNMNTKTYLDEAFSNFMTERIYNVKKMINLNDFEFKVQKTLPKYLKEGMTDLLVRIQFEVMFQVSIRKKIDADEFTKLNEIPKEIEKYIQNDFKLNGVYIRKSKKES